MDNLIPMEPHRKPPAKPASQPPREAITKANFFQIGLAFVQQRQMQIAATAGSPEHEAWEKYFRGHLGWEPTFLRRLERGEIEAMTLPAQWPEWFDPDYRDAAP